MGIVGNIWKLQLDRFFANFWIYAGILVPFLESNGLSASQIFITEAVFAAVVAATEIPTGYLSDVIGRKACFIIGSALIPVGVIIYTLSHGFWGFVAAEAVIGLGISFRSGTDSSYLYDTLLELKREKEYKHIEGHAVFLNSIGAAVANIMGGLISVISLRLPFIVNVFTFLILTPLAIMTKEPKRESRHSQNAKAHIKDLARALHFSAEHRVVRNAVLYTAFLNALGIVGYWLNYLFYSRLGIDVAYFGFIAAAQAASNAFGGKLLPVFARTMGDRAAFALPLGMGVCLLMIGVTQSYGSLPFVLLNSFLWGVSIPLLRNTIHANTPSSIRATVQSLANMGNRLFFVFFSVAMGYLVDASSVQTGFLCLGALFLVTTALPAFNLMRLKSRA